MTSPGPKVEDHFRDRAPAVQAIYARILAASKRLGPVREEPKKTSIHLVRKSAFAGIATRKESLILTLKSDIDRASPRIKKREQVSAHRWHLEIRLEKQEQVDREILAWLERAYALAE